MTQRSLPWQLVIGGLCVVAGAVILLLVVIDRAREPKHPLVQNRVAARVSPKGFGEIAVWVTDASGRLRKRCLLEARTERQRERGLMEVTDRTLGGHDGMVFLFDQDERGGFWMRNTPMPLSIAYFNRAGRIVSSTDMSPCRDSSNCPAYPPAGPYRSTIEVPHGRLAELGIGPGSRIRVGGRCDGAETS